MSDASDVRIEQSAGAVLLRMDANQPQALLMRARPGEWEVPKGHIEPGETAERAAVRELCEETGLRTAVAIGSPVGTLEYSFKSAGELITKRVAYFAALPDLRWLCEFGKKPSRTREIRWISQCDLQTQRLVSEDLRPIIQNAYSFLHAQIAGESGL